jgi:hypothetical protein
MSNIISIDKKNSDDTRESSTIPEMVVAPPWKSISFACGGWLYFYLLGVAKGLQSKGLDSTEVKYCGCSAGSLAAIGLVLDFDFDIAVKFAKYECLPEAHRDFAGLFKIGTFVERCLDTYLPTCYKKLSPGNLQLAITRLPWFQAERATEFESMEDLKLAMLASCGAFPFAPIIYRRGHYCLDGGISDFQPIVDEDTLTVSPFYFR